MASPSRIGIVLSEDVQARVERHASERAQDVSEYVNARLREIFRLDDELCVTNDDGMNEDERQRLHASIVRGISDGRAGREMDFDSFMDQLDAEP